MLPSGPSATFAGTVRPPKLPLFSVNEYARLPAHERRAPTPEDAWRLLCVIQPFCLRASPHAR